VADQSLVKTNIYKSKEGGFMLPSRDAYRLMFREYPDVVDIKALQGMLGVSRHPLL
jgi:hypothetical protein